MLNIAEYLESGIIEKYCLGLSSDEEAKELLILCKQYPEIEEYLQQTSGATQTYLAGYQKPVLARNKEIIKQSILENEAWANTQLSTENNQLLEYISISRTTDLEKVNELIKNLTPPTDFDNIAVHNLYKDEKSELMLVWAKVIVPEEEHPHVDESFLMLEGTLDCYIDDEIIHMKKGDFMRIPPHSKHKVLITSSTPAKAIQSRVLLDY